jgi:hypothetical protein
MSEQTTKDAPFREGEQIFWVDLSQPRDALVTFERYDPDSDSLAFVKLFGDTHRVPIRSLRRAVSLSGR